TYARKIVLAGVLLCKSSPVFLVIPIYWYPVLLSVANQVQALRELARPTLLSCFDVLTYDSIHVQIKIKLDAFMQRALFDELKLASSLITLADLFCVSD